MQQKKIIIIKEMIPIEPFSKLDAWYNCPYGVPIISYTSWILFDGMSYVFGVEVIVGHDVHALLQGSNLARSFEKHWKL